MKNMINKLNSLRMKGKKKGFTLIELLVVIIIIGILFVVLIPRLNFASDNAKLTGVKTDFHSIQLSMEQIVRTNSALPGTDLATAVAGINNASDIKFTLDNPTTPTKATSDIKDPFAQNYVLTVNKLSAITGGQPAAAALPAPLATDKFTMTIGAGTPIAVTLAATDTTPALLVTKLNADAGFKAVAVASVNADGRFVISIVAASQPAYGTSVALAADTAGYLQALSLKASNTGTIQIDAPGTPVPADIFFGTGAGNLTISSQGLGKNIYQ